ncbi:unnamed protein product [Mycena citricolor]|uniref:Bromodomain and PHD finger-containing protein 3 n=1 Tax=Mycena citricolor TaxID=2018698 RepID=A0AAD2H2Y1_9AGAR|nr:unnamed protein product [Mycena citricolor]
MAPRAQTTPTPTQVFLPKAEFRRIEDDVSTQPSGVHDKQAQSFGYNDFSEFERPDLYIRHIEPLEEDLERQVEYDMDEQGGPGWCIRELESHRATDEEWLNAVNAERRSEQMDRITCEVFEVVMDRLEKEWFNLSKHVKKPDFGLPSEDSTCAICDDSEGENSNAIVFCDGCNLAVHQDCYGIPYIPEGQWLCRKCTVSPENPVSCILCPNEGGAFKQTVDGEWIHLLCAIWVPETAVANDVFMEPIVGVEKIQKQRWKLKCQECGVREGACIQCAKTQCFASFHPTCARTARFLMPMKSSVSGVEPTALTCFCDKHLPVRAPRILSRSLLNELQKGQQEVRRVALEAAEQEQEDFDSAKLSKSARAYAKTYKPGAPLVPAIIVDRILQYIAKTSVRKKPDFVTLVARYWSLKREARRGAPLLKRLHLEPWTASNGVDMSGEEEKAIKLEYLKRIRDDLEQLRNLTELARKRESRKLKQAEVIRDTLGTAFWPHVPLLKALLTRIAKMDSASYFSSPVDRTEVPDYFDVVKNPMCWSEIESKILSATYWDLQAFITDVYLVLDNAVLYNAVTSNIHRAALRIRTSLGPIFTDAAKLCTSPNVAAMEETWERPLTGDLEPPLEVLDLLSSSEVIRDETELILSSDPIISLLNFELEKRKPPPPPPPTKAELEEERRIQRNAKERERRRLEKERKDQVAAARLEKKAQREAEESSAPPRTKAPQLPLESQPQPVESVSAPVRLRRQSATEGDIPLIEEVDNQKSFDMFNEGWILTGQRRNARQLPTPSAPPPPSKKRKRVDSKTPGLSTSLSTPVSESFPEEPPIASSSRPRASRQQPEQIEIPPPNVIRMEDGQVIVEHIDTPLIRKAKSKKAKEARALLKASASQPAAADEPASLGPSVPLSTPATDDVDAEGSSDLSPLSDAVTPGVPAMGPADFDVAESMQNDPSELSQADPQALLAAGPESLSAAPEPKTRRQQGHFTLAPGKSIEPMTLVWAQYSTFPFFPGIIIHEDDDRIPLSIHSLAQKVNKDKAKKENYHFVQFLDNTRSWQYVPMERLRMLGELPELDKEMLTGKRPDRSKKKSSAKEVQDLKKAYQAAMEEMAEEDRAKFDNLTAS